MRLILFLGFLCGTTLVFGAKKDEVSLKTAAQRLDRALEQKDTALLNRLLSPKLQYGHSNGWLETKAELIANLYNGKIVYHSIKETGKGLHVVIDGNTGLLREDIAIEVSLDNRPVNINLTVLQVWVFNNGQWKLIGRQSTKVDKPFPERAIRKL